jgi:hypothetical protein
MIQSKIFQIEKNFKLEILENYKRVFTAEYTSYAAAYTALKVFKHLKECKRRGLNEFHVRS